MKSLTPLIVVLPLIAGCSSTMLEELAESSQAMGRAAQAQSRCPPGQYRHHYGNGVSACVTPSAQRASSTTTPVQKPGTGTASRPVSKPPGATTPASKPSTLTASRPIPKPATGENTSVRPPASSSSPTPSAARPASPSGSRIVMASAQDSAAGNNSQSALQKQAAEEAQGRREQEARAAQEKREREAREVAEQLENKERLRAEALKLKRIEQQQKEIAQQQQRSEALSELRSGTRLAARSCYGETRIVGTLPAKAKARAGGCVDISYIAQCPDQRGPTGIRGTMRNFVGVSTDCFMGDAVALPSRAACTAEQLRVTVSEVNPCR